MASITTRRNFVLTVLSILLTIPFTLLIAILLVFVILPCYIYRSFVVILAHKWDPNFGKVVSGLSASQTRDFDLHTVKPYSTQVCCFRFNGTLQFEEFKEMFHRRVILRLDDTMPYPTLNYPELRQYITTFMGYAFLKTDTKFDYQNHFTVFNPTSNDPVRRKDVIKIWESLMIEPYPKERSPWQLILIKNYIPDDDEIETWSKSTGSKRTDTYWIGFLKIHHSLADGFAIQNMLSKISDEVYLPKFSMKMTPTQRFLLNLRTAFLGSYDALSRALKYSEPYHTMHRPVSEHSHEYFVVESKLISMTRVKLLKQKFKVAVTAVLVAAISGGIRNFLLKNSRTIPEYMSTVIPFADPEHSGKFGNKFSLASVGFGVHLEDPQDRVNYVKDQMVLLASSSWIKMLDLIIVCLGCLPIRFMRFVTQKSFFCSSYSTQPGPTKCLTSMGSKLLEITFSYGTNSDSIGFGLASLSYNDNFRVTIFIEKNLLGGSRECAEDLIAFISKEFEVLEEYNVSKNGTHRVSVTKPNSILECSKID